MDARLDLGRTAFRIDIWHDVGKSIVEHVADVDDFELAEATYGLRSAPVTQCSPSNRLRRANRRSLHLIGASCCGALFPIGGKGCALDLLDDSQ